MDAQDIYGETDNYGGASGSGRYKSSFGSSIIDEIIVSGRGSGFKPKCTMYRVSPQMWNVKPELYTPREISLGLIKRKPTNAPNTRGDQLRGAIACTFLKVVGMWSEDIAEHISRWRNLCNLVVPEPKTMQDLYEGSDLLSLEDVQATLTLDAIFLTCFLASLVPPNKMGEEFQALKDVLALIPETSCKHRVSYDIMMVENQIPFKLIQNVVDILFGKNQQRGTNFLRGICVNFMRLLETRLPGHGCSMNSQAPNPDYFYSSNFLESENILDCGYRLLVHDCGYRVLVHDHEESPELKWERTRNIPSVTRLQKAGIDFRGHREGFRHARFEPGPFKGLFKATLVLPVLELHEESELLWRNLLAFEHNQLLYGGKDDDQYLHFGPFLSFMDNLVDDLDDALCLAKGNAPVIILNQLGNFKAVARLFNIRLEQSCTAYLQKVEWVELKNEINKYFNSAPRRLFVEFIRTNFGKPWIAASVIAAVIVLIATILQTVYTVLGYYYV